MKFKWLPWGSRLAMAFAVAGCTMTQPVVSPIQGAGSDAKPTTATHYGSGRHLGLGYAYLDDGKYRPALLEFDLALADAEAQSDPSTDTPMLSACASATATDANTLGDPSLKAEIHSASGYALYLLHRLTPEQADNANQNLMDFARPRLTCALELAKQAKNLELEGRIRAYLGLVYARLSQDLALESAYADKDGRRNDQVKNLDLAREYRQQALAEFQKSQSIASANGNLALGYAAQLHLARLENDPSKRLSMIKQVNSNLAGVKDEGSRVNLMLNIMDQLDTMRKEGQLPGRLEEISRFELDMAGNAIALAGKAGMLRALSQSEGFLAGCYERGRKLEDAIRQTELAISHSVEAKASDLTMVWQSNLGRLLALNGQEEDAMMAYRRAMFYVDEIRNDIPMVYADGKSAYSETLEPIYRGMADLLLRTASRKPKQEDRQALLLEAIYSLEKLKESELEDYFNLRCSLGTSADDTDAPQQSHLNQLSPLSALGRMGNLGRTLQKASGQTAIIYPIIFKDRLELLLVYDQGNGKGAQIVEKTLKEVNEKEITKVAENLNESLNRDEGKADGWKPSSQKLYQWLIAPLQSELQSANINRLIYIPDGKLRLAPISAFYDGKSFIAEHYAVVVNNGLQFVSVQREQGALGKTLLAGLSKPDGSSIDQLPSDFQDAAVEWALVNSPNRGVGKKTSAKAKPQRGTSEYRQKMVEGMSLPSVNDEIHSLEGRLNSKTLMNENFTHGNLENDLQTGDYEFVHIASHGHFAHTAKESFIMTHDKTLHVDEVEKVIHVKPGKGGQIDLVTFSACETATGDDRAPLGFTGIAIKAKARNALGALWSVNDNATYQFMQKFYTALKTNGGDKANALQQAQKGMIQEPGLANPFLWAAFILVGSW